MTSLAVSEIFGPTIQGEGKFQGALSAFLRLGGCNLACTYCDTPYTWDWTGRNGKKYDPKKEVKKVDAGDVIHQLTSIKAHHLVITGGEPMLQQEALEPVLHVMSLSRSIEIETNGTVAPSPLIQPYVHHYDVSPKLSLAGGHGGARHHVPEALHAFAKTGRASFKFVVADQADLDEVDNFARLLYPGRHPKNFWVMPEGVTPDRQLHLGTQIADAAIQRGYNFTLRSHVLLWGGERAK